MDWSIAFTLVELLVVIAIITILAGLFLGVISKSKGKAHQIACVNNLRQLATAFALYHDDFSDNFPASGSKTTYGQQPEDWIWWQYGRDLSRSSILRFVGNFDAGVFTCPSDKEARELQRQGALYGDPFKYSYSLTSHNLISNVNPGMATIITQERVAYPFKVTSIRDPSTKIMLADESRKTIDDPRWIPIGPSPSMITDRHGGKGNVAFADGHVTLEPPSFSTNKTYSNPSFSSSNE